LCSSGENSHGRRLWQIAVRYSPKFATDGDDLGVADTGRMKRELISKLAYPTLAEGLSIV
jgi:hypothetical protein